MTDPAPDLSPTDAPPEPPTPTQRRPPARPQMQRSGPRDRPTGAEYWSCRICGYRCDRPAGHHACLDRAAGLNPKPMSTTVDTEE